MENQDSAKPGDPAAETSQVGKSDLASQRSIIYDRKALPPLPLLSPLPKSQDNTPNVDNANANSDQASSTSIALESLLEVLGRNRGGAKPSSETPEMRELPPPPISKDPPRPATAATTATASSMESKRAIKYGTGRHANTELSPQPSEKPEDPLNWPLWKKHLNLLALLSMVALVGVMKTAYISVNGIIAMSEDVSYTAAVALTGAPLILSAVTGMLSMVVAKIWGKRPVYLVSMVLIFWGVTWNTHVRGNLGQNMAARVFQGLGWGAFDTLVLGSIQDTYFEHERQYVIVAHHAVSLLTMLGSPLLGGVASAGPRSFEVQFEIMSAFLSVSVLLIIFAAPETAYDRVLEPEGQSPTISRSQALVPVVTYTKEAALEYLATMKPWSYQASEINMRLILQAPRALVAPTNGLLFAVTILPHAGLWGLAGSLSLLFTPLPFLLSSSSLGALMTGPFIVAAPVGIALSLPIAQRYFRTTVHLGTLAVGGALASVGLLGFGLYLAAAMEMPTDGSAGPSSTPWDLGFLGDRVSLPVASFLLGLLAAGSLALDATTRPVIQRSTAFTSANLAASLRSTADMHGGLACLRSLVVGAFVLGLPSAIVAWDGLKSVALGMGVTQIFVIAAVAAVYWYWDENVRRLDGLVMGLVDLDELKRPSSFFDAD